MKNPRRWSAAEIGALGLYQWLFAGVLGGAAGVAPWLERRIPRVTEGFHEYFGALPKAPDGPLIWVHGVSLGESLVAGAVMSEIRRRFPGFRLGFTTTHPDVLATARKRSWADVAGYFPLDFAPAMSRAFARWRPRLVIVSETDFWPVFSALCRRHQVPLILANGRISFKLERFYRHMPGLGKLIFGAFTRLLVQTSADADRLSRMGAGPESIEVAGNLKVDLVPAASPLEAGNAIRSWKGRKSLLLFGSLHPSEFTSFEPVFVELARRPHLCLLIAPRNLANVESWAKRLSELGLSTGRRSSLNASSDACDKPSVVFLDTMGELAGLYAFADAAFVGGSLDSAVGGHNPLEPLLQGVPTVMGSRVRNFADLCDELSAAGGLTLVDDAGAVQTAFEGILADPCEADRRRRAVEKVLARHRGALAKTLAVIEETLKNSARPV